MLGYLKHTIDYGIHYSHSAESIIDYADSDWTSDVNDYKPTCGYIFLLGGGPVSSSYTKQQNVAVSSPEAEYIGISFSAKEYTWLHALLQELKLHKIPFPLNLYDDDRGTNFITKNGGSQRRSKHISLAYHHIHDLIQNQQLYLHRYPTESMLVDMMTKALHRE